MAGWEAKSGMGGASRHIPSGEADGDGCAEGERLALRVAIGATVDAGDLQDAAAAEEGEQGARRAVAVGRVDAVAGQVRGGDRGPGALIRGEGVEAAAGDIGDEVAEAVD